MGPIIILIIVGLILLLVETLLIPGFAVTGILGLISMAAACWLAFTTIGSTAGIIVTVVCILLSALLLVLVLRSSTWKKVTLETSIDEAVDVKPEQKGISAGDTAVATTRLAPIGMIRFEDGRKVEAASVEGLVNPGTKVVVDSIEAEKIFVKKVK
ncbi:MAG: nodulation efficiency protein D (NfeD) [Bacteroidales bacterium]|nr:nodulation efficiency protein D (NfeD) [Bacteroidales bacterium]